MSQVDVERFLGRLITDTNFRNKAVNSLEIATHKEGIVLSKAELMILSNIDFSLFDIVSMSLDDSVKRS